MTIWLPTVCLHVVWLTIVKIGLNGGGGGVVGGIGVSGGCGGTGGVAGFGGGGNGLGGGEKSGGSMLIVPTSSKIERDAATVMEAASRIVSIHCCCDNPANFLPSPPSQLDPTCWVPKGCLRTVGLITSKTCGLGVTNSGRFRGALGIHDPVDTPFTRSSCLPFISPHLLRAMLCKC